MRGRDTFRTVCYYAALCYDGDCTVFEHVSLIVLHTATSVALVATLWLGYLRDPITLIALLVLTMLLSSLSTTAVCALFRRHPEC